jgi:hypothetical protein
LLEDFSTKMKVFNLNNFIRGWFIGNFEPSILKTPDYELGVKTYRAGDYEVAHHHKLATEITVIVSGEVEMNGKKYSTNDIIIIEPFESTDFKCITDVVTVVFKTISATNDKYLD